MCPVVRRNAYTRHPRPQSASLRSFLNWWPRALKLILMAARNWTSRELRSLGKCPDRELAAQIGRSLQAIVTKRSQLRIPRFISKGEPRPWSRDEEALLGTEADNVIARRLKRTAVATTK